MIAAKYGFVFLISARNRLAYIKEIAASLFFLIIILFVFVQLWTLNFKSNANSIEGFTLQMMIWYYVATETLVHSMPPLHRILEREIRDGDVAIRLNKPFSYLLFHFSQFSGEIFIRSILNLIVGGCFVYALVGGISFSWMAFLPVLFAFFLAQTLSFCWGAIIGLSAFWTEDISGLYFIMDRLKWLLGGFLLPISMFPEKLRIIAEMTPFKYMIYGPAKLAISFSWPEAAKLLIGQIAWMIPLVGICALLFFLGSRRLNLNGG